MKPAVAAFQPKPIVLPRNKVDVSAASLPNRAALFGMSPSLLLETAEEADRSGQFHSVWVGDNFLSKPRMEAIVTLSALAVAGSVIAQQLGLGFVTAVDPTQGQQGLLIGNFLTILGMTLLFATDSHHLVISALNESYRIFSPGELPASGDVAALATRAFAAAFKIGMQLSAPFLVFGLVFNIGLGVLARLMPQMQVYFVGVPLSIMVGFLIFALVLTGMMATYLNYFIGVMHELTPLK